MSDVPFLIWVVLLATSWAVMTLPYAGCRQDAKWLWMYESDNSTNSNGQAKRTTSNYRRQQTKDAAARLAL